MANKPGEANFFPDVPEFPSMGVFQPIYGKFDLTTYIQGASDYEIMAFLVGKYNACLEAYGTVTKLSTDTVKACKQLQDWINNWFDNLDVQEELNNKIDSMVQNGSFGTLLHQTFDAQINQQTTSAVTAWLVANVTPTGSAVVVDKTLSIEGAAADAKATGELKGDIANIANLINNYDITNVQYMKGRRLSETGEVIGTSGSDLYAVDIECVKPNTAVYIECTVNQYLPVLYTFHDVNGDFISKIDNNAETVTTIKKLINIPENCYFIKINGYTSNNFKFGTLKNNLMDSHEPLYPQYLNGGYVINNNWEPQYVGDGYGYYSIPCGKNDTFVISGKSTEYIPIFALKNKNGVVIENYGVSVNNIDAVITNKIITVPEDNCTLYVNCSNNNFQPIKKLNYGNNKTIYVDANGFGDFTTFREATEYCRSHENTTVIIRTPCNLVTEYGEDYFNNIPPAYDHNHSIGPECGFNCTYKFAQGAKLSFNYEGTNPLVAEMFSTVNIVGGCTFENMQIECKNCRYCVHEDTPTVLDVIPWYYTVKYKNCNMKHNGNTVGSYRNTACIGAGSSPFSTSIIENGVYKAVNGIASITYHLPSINNNTNSKVIIKNIYADGKVQTSDFGGGDSGKLEVEISGCSLSENLYFGTKTNYTEWNNIVRS